MHMCIHTPTICSGPLGPRSQAEALYRDHTLLACTDCRSAAWPYRKAGRSLQNSTTICQVYFSTHQDWTPNYTTSIYNQGPFKKIQPFFMCSNTYKIERKWRNDKYSLLKSLVIQQVVQTCTTCLYYLLDIRSYNAISWVSLFRVLTSVSWV